ncbi:hypothetical protein [Bdellovibrio sp. HCB-162]|uniref:hypothetical protein n=1 Tax=Bdellovibrio sp. HCB-162 TaxID=3394234 RepID=UPI0039BC92A6
MRNSLLILIISFFLPMLSWSQSLPMACSQLLGKCDKVPQPLQLASEACKWEQKAVGCEDLAKADADAAKHIRSCDPKALCDGAIATPIDQLRGCFSGAVDVGKEFWDAIASVPELAGKGAEAIKACWTNVECRNNALKTSLQNAPRNMMLSNPILAPLAYAYMYMKGDLTKADLDKAVQVSKSLLEKGKDYLKKQGVKLACFDTKTQAEMICYGVFSVVNPAGAAGLLAKAPKLGKLLKAAGMAAKEANVATKTTEAAVDLARMAKLSNPQRVAEAEKLLGRSLSEQQRQALIKAHEVGAETGRGYGTYSATDLKQKADILKAAGFSDAERSTLMRQGVAGLYSDTQKARNFANEARLEADKLRVAGNVKDATARYRNSADSYEVFMKDAKAPKSERDYLVGAELNARAERYEQAADYYIKSKASLRSNEKAEVIFETLRREKDELRVIAAKNRDKPGVQKAYEDHRKLIEAVVNNKNFQLGDAWKRELLKP